MHNLLFRIWKVLYACTENVNLMEVYADQVDIVRRACGEQESCSIEANSQVFGKRGECAGNFLNINVPQQLNPLTLSVALFKLHCTEPIISRLLSLFLGKDDSEFTLWLIYSCDGGIEKSTFRNDSSKSIEINEK